MRYGSAVRMPAGLTFIAIDAVFVKVLPSNVNGVISLSTMHCTSTALESFDHTMPWHQWPIFG
jgi:hypothetical protein